jgi:hypothetical protein
MRTWAWYSSGLVSASALTPITSQVWGPVPANLWGVQYGSLTDLGAATCPGGAGAAVPV